MKNIIKQSIKESIETKQEIGESLVLNIEKAAITIIDALKKGNKIMIAGNGGSAAQASHFSAELVGRYLLERKGIAAISLNSDTSIITAWTNDYEFDTVFSRQIESLGRQGDVFVGLTTSGNSENILNAIKQSKSQEIQTITLLGKDGGKIKSHADVEIIVPSNSTPRIQEGHILIIHILCHLVEEAMQ